MAAETSRHRVTSFIVTKEHRRFTEFVDAVRKHRYIGLCHGAAGVGKTLSATRYARWNHARPLLEVWGARDPSDLKIYAALAQSRSVFYTPTVGSTLRELRQEIPRLMSRVDICIEEHLRCQGSPPTLHRAPFVELLLVDETERLSTTGLDYLRDLFDQHEIGLVLIGMPGIEKRLSRYPQLYSRVGFSHQYRPLQDDELTFVLTRRWRELGLSLDEAEFTDAQAVATIVRITRGNFRLVHRLFIQIERVLRINDLHTITAEVVDAARSTLVIGDA